MWENFPVALSRPPLRILELTIIDNITLNAYWQLIFTSRLSDFLQSIRYIILGSFKFELTTFFKSVVRNSSNYVLNYKPEWWNIEVISTVESNRNQIHCECWKLPPFTLAINKLSWWIIFWWHTSRKKKEWKRMKTTWRMECRLIELFHVIANHSVNWIISYKRFNCIQVLNQQMFLLFYQSKESISGIRFSGFTFRNRNRLIWFKFHIQRFSIMWTKSSNSTNETKITDIVIYVFFFSIFEYWMERNEK